MPPVLDAALKTVAHRISTCDVGIEKNGSLVDITDMPTVIVDLGFSTAASKKPYVLEPSQIDKIALYVASGIAEYSKSRRKKQ